MKHFLLLSSLVLTLAACQDKQQQEENKRIQDSTAGDTFANSRDTNKLRDNLEKVDESLEKDHDGTNSGTK